MSNLEHGLGGRLPLLEPEKLQPKQRELYGTINSGVVPLERLPALRAATSKVI
jgi:hypothetical protein